MAWQDLPVFTALDQLVELIERGDPVFVRWSRGPRVDLGRTEASKDGLTGTELPGLSANPLRLEDWWNGRPTVLWVARRLYDYSHLREEHGPDVRPWALTGEEAGRGPDNEPLVRRVRPVAWIAESVISEAEAEVARQRGSWGPMRRPPRIPGGPSDTPGSADGERHGADGEDGPPAGGRRAS
ncbi:DUF6098 family protein [Streptomyces sp. NPDC048845]|uniref:DUF6098 family protein n=1 Tax=Streptomyces sp. NPDC048845 TaxID=3155390 RepID=UPI00343C78DE